MIKIKPIASGSSGNCYYVSDGNSNILLDCGIPVQKIKEFLWNEGKRLSDIDACLVTHSHGDHAKSARELSGMGICIYASKETILSVGLGHFAHTINRLDRVKVGSFYLLAYDVKHDADGTLAFSIVSNADSLHSEMLVYITDTMYFKYNLRNVTHLMIEANYDPDIIARNVSDGIISVEHAKRVVQNHMSIETCLKTIERMDRSRLKEIWLLHLSNDNAGQDFKKRVQEVAGCEVYIA